MEIQPTKWLSCAGGRWLTASGIDVSKFLWSKDKKFWLWITQMPESIVMDLMPQLASKYLNEKSWIKTIYETNRYRARMIHKLARYAEKRHIYEFNVLAKILIRNSKSFRAWIYDSTSEFKMGKLSPNGVQNAHLRFQRKVRHGLPKFRFKRVWIPKADGTMRPLAVPNLEDRWLAKIMTELTMIYLQATGKKFHENQMGSIPGRSTAQAWNKVVKDILPKKFILEFDVAKCYDTLSWDGIWKWMLHCDLPQCIQNYVLATLKSSKENLKESEYSAELNKMRRIKMLNQAPLWNIGRRWDDRLLNKVAGAIRVKMEGDEIDKWEKWERHVKAEMDIAKIQVKLGYPRPKMRIRADLIPKLAYKRIEEAKRQADKLVPYGADHLFENRFNNLEPFDCGMGIPQGWALAPLLCNFQMKAAFKAVKRAEWVTYLDDGLIGADSIEDWGL